MTHKLRLSVCSWLGSIDQGFLKNKTNVVQHLALCLG